MTIDQSVIKRSQLDIYIMSVDDNLQSKVERLAPKLASERILGFQRLYLHKKISKDKTPAILLVDIQSFETEIQLIKFVRRLKEQYRVQLIMITAINNSTLDMITDLRPDAYLIRPIRTKDLQMALQVALENYRRTEAIDITDIFPAVGFTPTERMILKKIAKNETTKAIAKALHVSESTIKNHRHNIAKKLKLSGGTHSLKNWVLNNKKK